MFILTDSRYGFVDVLTSPGASCSAEARLPLRGVILALGTKTVDATGRVTWTYAKDPTQSGVGVHAVTCTNQGQTVSEVQRFDTP
ncbi:MAG: hypothetical protein ABR525_08450 [Candidatus Limnocylindria bacterium]